MFKAIALSSSIIYIATIKTISDITVVNTLVKSRDNGNIAGHIMIPYFISIIKKDNEKDRKYRKCTKMNLIDNKLEIVYMDENKNYNQIVTNRFKIHNKNNVKTFLRSDGEFIDIANNCFFAQSDYLHIFNKDDIQIVIDDLLKYNPIARFYYYQQPKN